MHEGLGFSVAAFCAIATVVGCSHENTNAQPPNYQGAPSVQPASNDAIERIANTACDHEHQCNNIGANQHYASRDACLNDMRAQQQDNLRAENCPNGIDSNQLDKCVIDIRAEHCGSPLEALSRYESCRTGNLCRK